MLIRRGTNSKASSLVSCTRHRACYHVAATDGGKVKPRRAIRRQLELLLQQFYRRRVAEGTPQRFVGILSDPGQMEQNCSTHDRWPYET